MPNLTELPLEQVPKLAAACINGRTLARRTRERNFCIRRLKGVIAECRVFGIPVLHAATRIDELKFEQRMDTKLTLIYREWVSTDGPNYGLCDWTTFYFNALCAIREEDAANE